MVRSAAGWFTRRPGWDGSEGPRPVITIAPGVVSLGWPDISRQERTAERARETARKRVDELARYRAEYVDDPAEPEPSRVVSEWSRKSRARMTRTLAELDYGPLLSSGARLPMTTLTYPGDWEPVAPDGRAVKEHMKAFRKRFERAWGRPFVGIWKLEFQRRGAPHIHLWGAEPPGLAGETRRRTARRYRPAVGDGLAYRQWLSAVWADIVDHPDPEQRRRHQLAGTAVDYAEGSRMTDPKRLAVYFTKHGQYAAKEYQHQVPLAWRDPGRGPGRFWGYWGLEKATAGVELDPAAAVWAGRILRRYARAQGATQVLIEVGPGLELRRRERRVKVTRELRVPRGVTVDQETGEVRTRYRKVRRPVTRLANGRGFLCVNNGPSLAVRVAQAVAKLAPPPAPYR